MIKAPFTEEQVKILNEYQHGKWHGFTCRGHDDCIRKDQKDEGLLIATTEGMVCPCGDYKQDWAYAAMADRTRWPEDPETYLLRMIEEQKQRKQE